MYFFYDKVDVAYAFDRKSAADEGLPLNLLHKTSVGRNHDFLHFCHTGRDLGDVYLPWY